MRKNNKVTRKDRTKKLITRLAILLIAIGVLVGLAEMGHVWYRQQSSVKTEPLSQVLKNGRVIEDEEPEINGVPVNISIPSLQIELKVIPGYYSQKSNSWTLSNDKAQYGTMTAMSNNKKGATFIYAHALDDVFGRLPKISAEGEAIVTTDNGHKFTYKFRKSTITEPTDTSLFKYSGKPVLILQTCTGAWYQDRQLFVFDFVEVT
jgi:LPXTG-site transpeptidase (sortase) family protein